jgi:hypothetical protein
MAVPVVPVMLSADIVTLLVRLGGAASGVRAGRRPEALPAPGRLPARSKPSTRDTVRGLAWSFDHDLRANQFR